MRKLFLFILIICPLASKAQVLTDVHPRGGLGREGVSVPNYFLQYLPIKASDFNAYTEDYTMCHIRYSDYEIQGLTSFGGLLSFHPLENNGKPQSIISTGFLYVEKFGERVLESDFRVRYTIDYDKNHFPNKLSQEFSRGRKNENEYNYGAFVINRNGKFTNKLNQTKSLEGATNASADILYERDAKSRVIKAIMQPRNIKGKIIFIYEYLPNSDYIKSIKSYDYEGKLIETIEFEFTAKYQIRKMHYVKNVANPNFPETVLKMFEYDEYGNIRKYTYEKAERMLKSKSTITFTNKYDGKGNLVSVDGVNRSTSINNNRESNHGNIIPQRTFEYDTNGNWIKMQQGDCVFIREIKYSSVVSVDSATRKNNTPTESTLKSVMIEKDGERLWGLVDNEGNEVIAPQYEFIYHFTDNMPVVQIDQKLGIINSQGEVIIPIQYDYVICFIDDLAAVKLNEKWGFFDKRGKQVVSFKYDDISMIEGEAGFALGGFSEGLAAVEQNGKWGFINKNGSEVIPFIYDSATSFRNGIATISLNGQKHTIDKSGKRTH
jgi:KWG leptospira repeat protein